MTSSATFIKIKWTLKHRKGNVKAGLKWSVDPQALVWLAPHIPVFALRCFPPPITFLL
jgi:hypothetical protein